MKPILHYSFFCFILYSNMGLLTAQGTTFQTPIGQINAWMDQTVIRATGIPYATADRFQKPIAIQTYPAPVDATQYSPACPQRYDTASIKMFGSDVLGPLETSENCLVLSVTRPHNNSENLPVMIWIHGGSYIAGAGDATIFDSKTMVTEQNVIVVNVTYRLGLFGFLGGYNDIPSNLGYLDIIEALRWVNKNIASFGGNPKNVTLFGQSAGGDAIAQLMVAKGTENLFQNVIIQSAPFGLIFDKEEMLNDMIEVAKEIPKNAPTEEIVSKQTDVLAAASDYGLKAGMPFGVQYGKYPFPKETEVRAAWKKRAKKVNVLIGFANKETAFFVPLIPEFQAMAEKPIIGGLVKSITVNKTSQLVYKKGSKAFAKNCALGGNHVYLYKILWGSKKDGFGASHTIDLPLLFGDSSLWKDAELVSGIEAEEIDEAGKEVRALWARFARTGKLDTKGKIKGVLKYKQK